MPIISNCPKCHAQVTIPDGLDPETEVRCPLCVDVYALREAMAEAPPALIPVDAGAIRGPGPHSDALAKSDLVSERFHVPDTDDVSGPLGTEAEPPADEAPALDHWREVDVAHEIDAAAADDASPAIDTGQTPVDTDALAAFGTEQPEAKYEPLAASPSTRVRRKKTEKSPARFMIEVFLGGALGLTIGYYALCWILGSQHGLPKLPLPLLPHTMHWFERAEEPGSGPGQPAPEGDRGVTYLRDGEFDKAIAEFTKEIQLDPASATTYGNRAGAYVAKGEFDKAIDDYTEAIRLNPELAGAYLGRGVAYDCSGEPDKAIADYDEAIRLNPRYAEAYNGRGEAYAQKGEPDKAIADYDEAIRLDPTDYVPYLNRGKAYEKKGEKSKAQADFAKAKELGYKPE